jgi:hypothetical protein
VKGILQSEVILMWEDDSLYEKYPLQMKLRNSRFMEQYNLCQRQECLAHCFPMRIQLAFEGNAVELSGIPS